MMIQSTVPPLLPLKAHRAPSTLPPEAAAPRDSVRLSGGFSLQQALVDTAEEAASLAAKLADEEYVPGEVLVKLGAGLSTQDLDSFAKDYGAKVKHHFEIPSTMLAAFGGELISMKLPENLSTAQALAAMKQDPRVLTADSNDIVHAVGTAPAEDVPNDLDGQLWGLQNTGQNGGTAGVDIKAVEAWAISKGSRTGPVVAVIDSGVDYGHRDLAANIWTNPNETADGADSDGNGVVDDVHGYNAEANSGDPSDENGHGTHCAGSIGAVGNNGTGVVGVNWEAQIMPIRFLSAGGSGTTEDSIKAVLYATRMGARITSNSWAGNKYNQLLFDALEASPALHICAAGNEGYDNDIRPVYPASYRTDNIISVAAFDNQDRLARFSNRGEGSVHLAGPGVDIYSTQPGNKYQLLSGTSMATPHVAGVATLIATAYPEASNDDIKRRLLSGVDPMPEEYGRRLSTGGRMNALKAMENDTVAPAQVADLRASDVKSRSVNLTWTATGDDGAEGRANGYELRYSTLPIVEGEAAQGQVTFDNASPVTLPAPREPGATEYATVQFAPSGRPRKLYFGLKAIDNVGNRSPVQVIEVDVPTQPVVLEDSMDGGSDLWTPEGTWARIDEPGRGKVWTDSPSGDYAVNTNHSLASREFSLEGFTKSKLYVDLKYDTEQKHDEVVVEVYGKGWFSRKWREVGSFTGLDGWKTREIDLSDYDGQDKLRVRVRMASDKSRTRDGVYVDSLVVTGEPGEAPSGGCTSVL